MISKVRTNNFSPQNFFEILRAIYRRRCPNNKHEEKAKMPILSLHVASDVTSKYVDSSPGYNRIKAQITDLGQICRG